MLQKFLSGAIAEEWAHRYYQSHPPPPLLLDHSDLAKDLSDKSLAWLQGKPPLGYHELTPVLVRIHAESTSLLQSFSTQCKLPSSAIPHLGSDVDVSGMNPGAFTVDTAQQAIGIHYHRLRDSLGRTKKKELAAIHERRDKIDISIKRYHEMKAQYDNRVSASFAGAFVAFESVPDKVSPVVKGIMNGIKVCSPFLIFL
jgi:TATA-binding protein-associated factor